MGFETLWFASVRIVYSHFTGAEETRQKKKERISKSDYEGARTKERKMRNGGDKKEG